MGGEEAGEISPRVHQVPGYDERGRDAEGRTHTEVFAKRAAAFLRSQEKQPFFLYLAPYAPHTPSAYPQEFARRFTEARVPRGGSFNEADVLDKPRVFRNTSPLTEAQIREYDKIYRKMARSTKDVDRMLGVVTTALEEAGELDNTYVVFTSDNGYHWGQHRLAPGKWTAYEEDIRVPLVVAGPGVAQGKTRPQMVVNTDLAPTISAWAGAEPMREPDGRSLVPLLSSKESPLWRTSLLVVGRPRFEAVRRPGRLYVEYDYGDRELYNLRTDPAELENIAGRAPVMEAKLAAILAELRSCAGASCRAAEGGRR